MWLQIQYRAKLLLVAALFALGVYVLWLMECPLASSAVKHYGLMMVFKGYGSGDLISVLINTGGENVSVSSNGAFLITLLLTLLWTVLNIKMVKNARRWVMVERIRISRDQGVCVRCGYDLRGASEREQCPECGSHVKRSR